MMRRMAVFAFAFAVGLFAGFTQAADVHLAQGGLYGYPRPYRSEDRLDWAVGTFHGHNRANGHQETITIQPDGNAELRTPGKAPEYGMLTGEKLTIGQRISKVRPSRGGIVVDGSYYRR